MKSLSKRNLIYQERGIEAYNDGLILLERRPKCHRENYAPNIITGQCTWCDYNAHKDAKLKERINHQNPNNNKR